MVRFTLEADSAEELELKIKEYLNMYHPCGYGTWIDSKKEVNGKWFAHGHRYSSCD